MSIPPISPLAGLSVTAPVSGAGAAAPATDAAGGFGQVLAKGLDTLDGLQKASDTASVQAMTGQLTDIHDYTIAANEAALATQLTVAVRNKAVEAFTEIMRMPV